MAGVLGGLLLPAGGCALRRHARPAPPPSPHPTYVVGVPYQAGGLWRYPAESFELDETGLAAPAANRAGLTEDGEVFDQTALVAAHPTLQLPAIVQITNLDNGLRVDVRVNARGPADPGRLIALSRRAFELLGAAGQPVMRVRIAVRDGDSRRLAIGLRGDGPGPGAAPAITPAPRGSVMAETLAPPAGAAAGRSRVAMPGQAAAASPAVAADAAVIPLRLPEQVTRVAATPTVLLIECGVFGRQRYAAILQARLGGLGARIEHRPGAPADRAWRVVVGPLEDVGAADAMLVRALRAGVLDSRIVAEPEGAAHAMGSSGAARARVAEAMGPRQGVSFP